MDPFFNLIILCLVMFFGSFGVAYLPHLIPLKPGTLKGITAFGAGLLVGTALIVIIPEGIHMFFSE